MKPYLSNFLFLLLLALCACQQAGQEKMSVESDSAGSTARTMEGEADQAQPPPAPPAPPSASPATVARKIIKEGNLSFETTDLKATSLRIDQAVKETGSYVSDDQFFEYDDRVEHRLSIRVPADRFDDLVAQISASAGRLESKNISAQDVTEEFIDVEARVKTKKQLENRYLELLKKATKVEDILAIEREIGALRSEIESVEGRLRYLGDRVSMATLSVTYYERSSKGFGFGTRLGQALGNGWNNLLWFLVGLTSLWPFLLIGLLGFGVFRRYRNKLKSRS